MLEPLLLETREERTLVVAFVELTRYTLQAANLPARELADTMDAYYELCAARAGGAGGAVVKFMGDGALLIFPEDGVDRAVEALAGLKEEIDAFFAALGWACRAVVKVHVGPVMAGPYGAAGAKRFDLLGPTVNSAARLGSEGVALSAEVYRRLSSALRERFPAPP